ncbi:MAG: hypothetical protein ACJAXM_001581 [Arenicella sp.]|jgi:hypothetical protein
MTQLDTGYIFELTISRFVFLIDACQNFNHQILVNYMKCYIITIHEIEVNIDGTEQR